MKRTFHLIIVLVSAWHPPKRHTRALVLAEKTCANDIIRARANVSESAGVRTARARSVTFCASLGATGLWVREIEPRRSVNTRARLEPTQ